MDNSGMDIKHIRCARFALLISERYASQADYVTKTGMNQGEVSSLLNPNSKKSFGEKKARSIERDNQLPVGWLDQADGEVPEAPTRPQGQTVVSNALNLACETAREMRLLSVYRLAGSGGRELIDTAVDQASLDLDLDSMRNQR